MTEQQSVQVQPSLSFKNQYNHFFLVHDFFHKITKTKAHNSDYFDLQIQVYNGMKNAVETGSKIFQGLCCVSLCYYFFQGRSIKLKFLTGFLFTYWYNHIITLGGYAGAFARLPSVYKKAAKYYQAHPQEKNLVEGLNELMRKSDHYEQPQLVLPELFGEIEQQKSYVANDFFVKNKEKYLPKQVMEENSHNSKKLKYMDSFLTRYVYYSFERWCDRMKQFMSWKNSE